MKTQILFENKEDCLEYYRQDAREYGDDWNDRDVIIGYALFKDYPDWFDVPELTEQERIELKELSKYLEERREVHRSQRQKIHVS